MGWLLNILQQITSARVCLASAYVISYTQQPASHRLCGHPGFFIFLEDCFLGANLCILQKQEEFVKGCSGHKGLGITLCKRIGAYSILQHLHLKPSFHNENYLIKYPFCICSFHQPPVWIKKNWQTGIALSHPITYAMCLTLWHAIV